MTHRGPFQPLLFCDSVNLTRRALNLSQDFSSSPLATEGTYGHQKGLKLALNSTPVWPHQRDYK